MARTEIRYLEGGKLRVELPAHATHPRIEVEGELCIRSARIRRAFPLSNTEGFISIQDGAGKELGILKSLDSLDGASKAVCEALLEQRYFTPRISAIDNLKQDGGMWLFQVKTQRGPATFYVRSWRDSSHEISQGRFQIVSVDGQRFEISDLGALDDRSQAFLDQLF